MGSNIIIRLTEYDLMTLANNITGSQLDPGRYYYCTDSRVVKYVNDNHELSLIAPLVVVNTEIDRQYNVTPNPGTYYYIIETNELWIFSNSRWELRVGLSKKYNGFYYAQGGISGTDPVTVLDNNGLLGDGSVAVRDINRIIKGKFYIDADTSNPLDTNDLVITSIAGGGIKMVPDGNKNGSGTTTLIAAGTIYDYNNDTPVTADTGMMILNEGKYYIKKEGVLHEVITDESSSLANDGKISIKVNGVLQPAGAVGYSFSANQANDIEIPLTIPSYENKQAASGGADVSLCTTGEKYTWNNKLSTASLSNGDVTRVGSTTVGSDSTPIYLNATNGSGAPTAVNMKNMINAGINALDTGSSTPVDEDYMITQYADGNRKNPPVTTYHRRPLSKLWDYIRGKLFSTTPTSGNVVIADGNTGKLKTSSYTIAKSVPSNALFTDNDTTYTLSSGTNKIVLTPSTGDASDINIKTINSKSILGSGDIEITSAVSWGNILGTLSEQTDLNNSLTSINNSLTSLSNNKQDKLTAGTNITISNNTISTSAEVNQNAFSNVKVGSTTIAADQKTDTLELTAGTNITLTPDATNDKVTITTSAEVNQNAFSSVSIVNSSGTSKGTATASGKTDTVTLKEGANITFSVSGKTITVTAADNAAWGKITGSISSQADLNTALNSKQATLVSGTNIKTVNGNSLLGSGNINTVPVNPSSTTGLTMWIEA